MGRILVTGAAKSGYGEAITRRLIADGHDVMGVYDHADASLATRLFSEYGAKLTMEAIDLADRTALIAFLDKSDTYHPLFREFVAAALKRKNDGNTQKAR